MSAAAGHPAYTEEMFRRLALVLLVCLPFSLFAQPSFDVVIANGRIVDGAGKKKKKKE